MPKNKPLPPFARIGILWGIIFLALAFAIGYIYKTISTADYFRVKEVLCRGGNRQQLSYLKGKNIFAINLGAEANFIRKFYPNYSFVRMVRLLPDRIFVDFIRRKPVAVVRLYRNFAIDKNGIFFDLNRQQVPELPLVTGLEGKIASPKPGVRYNLRELRLVLNIIREARSNQALADYPLKKIDVSNTSSVVLFFALPLPAQNPLNPAVGSAGPRILEVKLPAENTKDKIDILAGLISAENKNLPGIKYIDLRFKDALIKFREATTYGTK
ncbi:MAG: hypothetical protein WC628_10260 [Candidatus Omnitrophota bacterium]